MGTKSFAFLVAGTMATGALLSGCNTPPKAGHGETVHEEAYPLARSAEREEVDRQFNEIYPGAGNWTWIWFRDRWMDLWDVVEADIAFGQGFGVNAHATEILQAGMGTWEGTSMGLRGRAWGMWEESKTHRGLGPWYWIDVERSPLWGTKNLFDHEYEYTGWDIMEETGDKAIDQDWTSIGASAQVLAVGAHVAASPLEAVDFIAGLIPVGLVVNWFGVNKPIFDIMEDDTYSRLQKKLADEQGLGE